MKKSIFYITFAILFILSMFNIPLSVHAEAIPSVIEQNISKMDKISDHGAEFVVDYISESWDYQTVENILGQVKTLSDELCAGCMNDYDKICVLANYVSSNIAYDFDAKHNAVTFDVISLENVLEKKRTTCAGFSNLFSSLCNAQGLYCVNIRGSAVSHEDGIYAESLDDENTVMNHEWTAVYYNDEQRWVYVDCTWNSPNTYRDGQFFYGSAPSNKYLDISVEDISKDHKALMVEHREFFDALTVLEKPVETNVITEIYTEYYENPEITEIYEEPTNEEIFIDNNDVQQTETDIISNTETISEISTLSETSISLTTSLNTVSESLNSESSSNTTISGTSYSETEIETTTQKKKGTTNIVEDSAKPDRYSSNSDISEKNNMLIFIIFIPIIAVILIIIKVMGKK